MESWKEIEGYDGRYFISDTGKVKSYARKPEIILKPRVTAWGYQEVCLNYKGKRKGISVHRLVALNFVSGKTTIRKEVNHIDGNKLNNNVDNLEWLSHVENMKHASDNSLFKGKKGELNNRNILSEKTVLEVKKMLSEGFRNFEIMEKLDLKYWHVGDIKSGKTWGWLKPESK